MARLIDKLIASGSASKTIKNGNGRERPKKWMKNPVCFRFSAAVDYGRIAAKLKPFCDEQKITITTDPQNTGSRFQKIVMGGFPRWECAMVVNNDKKTELLFQVLNWYDNAGNNIQIFKLISFIERTILSTSPDAIVVENNEQKRLADLYR